MDKEPGAFRTISEVAEELDVPQHVLRFWETRFSQIRPLKRGGGRRFYRPEDVLLIRGIRHLLYGEGYTIKGVQRILKEEGVRHVQQAAGGDADDAADMQEWPAGAPEYGFPPGQDEGGQGGSGGQRSQYHDDDLPSVVRPRPYAAQHHNADVMASPPVAGWRDDAWDPAEHRPAPGGGLDALGGPYNRDAPDARHGQPAPAAPVHDVASHDVVGNAFPDLAPEHSAPSTQAYPPFDGPAYDEQVEATGPAAYGAAPHAQGHMQDHVRPHAPDYGAAFAPAEILSTSPRLDAGQRARLQEALAELLECRRLLAHARGDIDAAD